MHIRVFGSEGEIPVYLNSVEEDLDVDNAFVELYEMEGQYVAFFTICEEDHATALDNRILYIKDSNDRWSAPTCFPLLQMGF